MEIQLKKGLLEAYVLSILREGPTYGYKLFDTVAKAIEISSSTLYPILRRLQQQGVLETYQEQSMGRLRNYYRITESGRKRLEEYKVMCAEVLDLIKAIMEENNDE
ncbi:MAG: PadR family transcriptional regulator [Erysipelotrichales bacterium]|nr:PadR family transcriptional regulator [Erysipelotrichales bacterium]